jgi:HEAT repeats
MNTPHAFVLALFFACLVLRVSAAFASAEQSVSNALQTGQPASINLTLSKQANTAIRLEVRAAQLAQILKAIADKTGVNIHYSVLPEAPVTATCVGANVGQIMDCLIAKQVGLVAHKPQKDKPAEFWLLGSSVGSCQAVTVAATLCPVQAPSIPAVVEQQPMYTPEEQEQIDQGVQEQLNRFLEQAKSEQPGPRAEAIANLTSGGGIKDDPNIRRVLEEALTDKDANVRAQAIESMARFKAATEGVQ